MGGEVSGWADISDLLRQLQTRKQEFLLDSQDLFIKGASRGTAFLTFDMGIDGVSIEMAKYARALESQLESYGDSAIHFIAGDFMPQADWILETRWQRHLINGINGWSKWEDGKWFDRLFFEDMPEESRRSSNLAAEIYHQAVIIAQKILSYLSENEIGLLIPVNVASNPGNLALTLGLVFATEISAVPVININHDFYWDGGKPARDRAPEEEPGSRDHFFRNIDNRKYFSLFKKLYPWNGRRWLQININQRQSKWLIQKQRFPANKVFEISTSVGDSLLEEYSSEDVSSARRRMAFILSDGAADITARSLSKHRKQLSNWMADQVPIVVGADEGLKLDLAADDILYFLQPTRVVGRKRIERGIQLIQALLQGPLSQDYSTNHTRQLLLHISGPTPLEHQPDLEIIFDSYSDMINSLPQELALRTFLAFSGGQESHHSFLEHGYADLNIVDIYRLASVILFPSEIEGRGLPIIESAAVGIPIICSRYRPEAVFADVIGEDLPDEYQIRYLHFPEGDFSDRFLREAAELITNSNIRTERSIHNRQAVILRYSAAALRKEIRNLLRQSFEVSRSPVQD